MNSYHHRRFGDTPPDGFQPFARRLGAVDKIVAQVSNQFPTCCIAGLPACESCGPSHAREESDVLPIGNRRYSRLETVGNLRYAEAAGLCRWPWRRIELRDNPSEMP